MKKLFKRIAILICIVTLFNLPISTLAASPTPVLIFADEQVKFFHYQPAPYYSPKNTGIQLRDLSHPSGLWEVPAGNGFRFYCNLLGTGEVTQIIILDRNSNQVYNEVSISTATSPTHEVTLPPATRDEAYYIVVAAVSDINITGYMGAILEP